MPTRQAAHKNYITAEDLINKDLDFGKLTRGGLLPDIAYYKPILIHVVCMPKEVGGGPIAAYWTREKAEKEARDIQKGDLLKEERQRREKTCLPELSEPRIIEIALSGLYTLWSEINIRRN